MLTCDERCPRKINSRPRLKFICWLNDKGEEMPSAMQQQRSHSRPVTASSCETFHTECTQGPARGARYRIVGAQGINALNFPGRKKFFLPMLFVPGFQVRVPTSSVMLLGRYPVLLRVPSNVAEQPPIDFVSADPPARSPEMIFISTCATPNLCQQHAIADARGSRQETDVDFALPRHPQPVYLIAGLSI